MSRELYEKIEASNGKNAFVITSIGNRDFGSKIMLEDGKAVWESENCGFLKENLKLLQEIKEGGVTEIAGEKLYIEQICNPKKLIICGAGHVSLPIIKIGKILGFEASCIDDREYFTNRAKNAGADFVYCDEFATVLKNIESDYDTYFVVVTRGHHWDKVCIREILKKPYAYIGLMGSKRRTGFVKNDILEEGFSQEKVNDIHTPIGLHIFSETPEEIAVSIMAQIISVKNSRKKNEGYVDGMLHKILENDERKVLATIVSKRGSAPREVGTKALFMSDGSFVGTVGGGKAENDIFEKAKELLEKNEDFKPFIFTSNLTDDDAVLEGMVCGGRIEVLMEPV